MAKVFTIPLGGKEWPLAYGPREAIALKRRFGKPLADLLRQDVMGMQERPKTQADCKKPDEVVTPGETVWEARGTHDLEVQIAFLHAGIVCGGGKNGTKQVTEENVLDWVAEHMKSAHDMGPIVAPVWKAVMYSGVTGASVDMDAVIEGGEPEGKA
jgi:hypothetical protein